MRITAFSLLLLGALLLSTCQGQTPPRTAANPLIVAGGDVVPEETALVTATSVPPAAEPAATLDEAPALAAAASPPAATASPSAHSETAALSGSLLACGQLLPIVSDYEGAIVDALDADAGDLARLRAAVPSAAEPALTYMLASPQSVGLAAYRVGQEGQGAYLNSDVPMPLASVVKVIHLVAYAEAVASGELDPTETVFLSDIDAFYLPNIDLGAHPRALQQAEANGRVFGNPPAVLLDEVPGMMIASSSNAATDYLHLRLGQERIEETARALGLSSQTAPCPFIGQFLAMDNHVLSADNRYQAWEQYVSDPRSFGQEAMLLTEAFSTDEAFRQAAVAWRNSTRRPTGQTQRLFSGAFNAQGSAGDYAGLMARIAQNGLSNGESSYIARRFLEWPMQFEDNQALFSNLGYKNGSLPGILTTVYYAYPRGETAPIVVALFFRDLPGRQSRDMRENLAQDELARWLLYDPDAIPLLRTVLP